MFTDRLVILYIADKLDSSVPCERTRAKPFLSTKVTVLQNGKHEVKRFKTETFRKLSNFNIEWTFKNLADEYNFKTNYTCHEVNLLW